MRVGRLALVPLIYLGSRCTIFITINFFNFLKTFVVCEFGRKPFCTGGFSGLSIFIFFVYQVLYRWGQHGRCLWHWELLRGPRPCPSFVHSAKDGIQPQGKTPANLLIFLFILDLYFRQIYVYRRIVESTKILKSAKTVKPAKYFQNSNSVLLVRSRWTTTGTAWAGKSSK